MGDTKKRTGKRLKPREGSTSRRIRERLARSRRVQVWFWDGVREYTGEASSVSPEKIEAELKISQFGSSTIVPTPVILNGLIKPLTRRAVEFKISARGMEANTKGKVTAIGLDPKNSRRLILHASFDSPSERNKAILRRLGQF